LREFSRAIAVFDFIDPRVYADRRIQMSRVQLSGLLLAFGLGAATTAMGDAAPVAGVVKHLQAPIPGALVFVYGVSDARLNRARTQPDGSFQVEGVPAGVYDVIAYKTGFYPSLIRLWHQSAPTVSTIAIDLIPSQTASLGKGEADVWSWRDRLPADVLREITSDSQSYRSLAADRVGFARVLNGDFASSASVGTGGQFSRSQANLFGTLPGSLQYSLRGTYQSLRGGDPATALSEGNGKDAVLLIAGSADTAVALTYAGRDFSPAAGDAARMEREAIRFDHQSEGGGRFEWSLSRRAETGFERVTSVIPEKLPAAGEDDELRGRWSRETDEARAGVTLEVYRRAISAGLPQGEGDGPTGSLLDAGLSAAADRPIAGPLSVGARLAARAGSSGSAIAPGGILRVDLGGASLVISGARRVSETRPSTLAALAPRVVSGNDWVSTAAASDASAALSLGDSRAGSVQLRASSTRIAEPLRVYFDGDLLLDVGSIYLFDGNRVEKLSGSAGGRLWDLFDAAVTAEAGRISGRVAGDSRESFAMTSNDGRYYSGTASLTVRPTRTDFTCAMRRVRQVLQGDTARVENDSDVLRLSLGQDLTVLGFDPFGTAWKLIVSYETESTPVVDSSIEETALLRHRVMGGVSISF
jgi:hypothetical protein